MRERERERERERSTPKVSVIIPLYNKADYIKRAIDSVLAQSEQDFEIIVVGGNSTDGGDRIVQKYTDSRISLVKERSKGVSAARNQGVDISKSNWIAFLDADDEWQPNFLETMLHLSYEYPDAGIYGCLYNYNEKNKPIIDNKCNLAQNKNIILWRANSKKTYFYYCAVSGEYPIQTSGVLIPKTIFQEYNGFNTNMMFYEDVDLWDKIAFKYDICTTKELLSIYHIECSSAIERIYACNNKYEQPFIKYIETVKEENILPLRKDLDDIQLYIESLSIEAATVSEHYSKVEAINYLLSVHSKDLLIRKYMMMTALLLPKYCRKYLKTVLNRCRKLNIMNK